MGINVIEVTDSNFEKEVLQSSVPVLVDFSAQWCGPCKQLAPIVDKLADEYVGTYKVGQVDVDASPDTARKYGVRSVPTVIVFKEGQVVAQQVGLAQKETLVKLLEG